MNLLKKHIVMLAVIALVPAGCDNEQTKTDVGVKDIGLPLIRINGNEIDTTCLYINYADQGASYFYDRDRIPNCNDQTRVTDVKGTVNTNLPGTYFITYHATDTLGNALTPATRTVHVVENSAGFLNGRYDVTCTCTANIAGVSGSTITAGNYTAMVTPGAVNGRFELVTLNLGKEKVVPRTSLNGNAIDIGITCCDYAGGSATGTLSPTKNSFTIESTVYPFSPRIIYKCKNIYTKQLILNVAGNDK